MLSAIATAVGSSRRICLKPGWHEPGIIWTCVVGDSGTQKSPAFDLALAAIRERQSRYFQKSEEDRRSFEQILAAWKVQPRAKRGAKPTPPTAQRLVVDDATLEALIATLAENPRGLLLARDEIAGWLRAFDRYGRSGDVARWLELHRGGGVVVDRKSSGTVFVPSAAVSIAGGIQFGALRSALTQELRDNGLAARLLMAYPPRRQRRWTDKVTAPEVRNQTAAVFDALFDHRDAPSKTMRLTAKARTAWITSYDVYAEEQVGVEDHLAAAFSKIEAYAARLALVVHAVRCVTAKTRYPERVDLWSMMAGIQMASWFADEARRVYRLLGRR